MGQRFLNQLIGAQGINANKCPTLCLSYFPGMGIFAFSML